jgi:hypothetical protein
MFRKIPIASCIPFRKFKISHDILSTTVLLEADPNCIVSPIPLK